MGVKRRAFESLLEGGVRKSDELLPAFRRLGIDPDHWAEEYSIELWVAALDAAGQILYPDLSPSGADRELGRLFMEGYGKTLLGSVVVPTLMELTPGRLLDRLPRFLSYTRDDATADVEVLGERGRRIHYRATSARPEFVAGTLLEGLAKVGVRAELEMESPATDVHVMTLRW